MRGVDLWIPAERLPQFRALRPNAELDPPITAPAAYAKDLSSDTALIEIMRGRLEGLGPVTPAALAAPLGLRPAEIAAALAALEAEGFAMRGRFSPDAAEDEWCERRLLARIHHYTVKRLRAEIQPVAARDFMRFLLRWQHVDAEGRMAGPRTVDTVVAQLEGFEAPAGSWESEILPARIADYEPDWLDDRCLAGKITWKRLRPVNGRANGSDRRASPVRTTPITLLPRRHATLWSSLSGKPEARQPSPRARQVAEYIGQHGASFFDELVEHTGLLRSQVEDALGELVALGLVSSDSFGGLRALLVPSTERRPTYRRRRRRAKAGMEDAGRWTLTHRTVPAQGQADAIEHVARALLNRYGVVFWRLLEREANWLPPWRDLLRVYRRLESRGDIRGGRFVAGFSGEQFALPDATGSLRDVCRAAPSGAWTSLSGADPLNLCGILSPGPRLAALTGNRVLYRDGMPVALLAGGDVQFLEELDERSEWEARKALLLAATPAPSILPAQEALGPALAQTVTPPRPSPAR
jgi:ATP-dependent Lhr-like helicase